MILVISASPNSDGLTAACVEQALAGIREGGGEAEYIDLSVIKIQPCLICKRGWGDCLAKNHCIINDALPEIQRKVKASDGIFLITPVYFNQPAERMKYFLDRYRRSEAFRKDGSWAAGKPVFMLAAAGGSGNGTETCLFEMVAWCRHIGANPAERIAITNYSKDGMLPAVRAAGRNFAEGKYFDGRPPMTDEVK
jgi:multimeric flavodoxin WrbA